MSVSRLRRVMVPLLRRAGARRRLLPLGCAAFRPRTFALVGKDSGDAPKRGQKMRRTYNDGPGEQDEIDEIDIEEMTSTMPKDEADEYDSLLELLESGSKKKDGAAVEDPGSKRAQRRPAGGALEVKDPYDFDAPRIPYGTDHLDWEENAKRASVLESETVDLTFEGLRKVPLPPAPELRSQLDPELVTAAPVTEHSKKDLGMYYYMGEDSAARLPKLLTNNIQREWDAAAAPMLMVRPAGLELAQETVKFNGKFLLVDGKKGTGKTAALTYAAHCALESGAFVLSPSMDEIPLWEDTVGAITPEAKEGFAYPSVFPMPDATQRWFHWLCDTHTDLMKSVRVKGDYAVEDYYQIDDFTDEDEKEVNPTREMAMKRLVPENQRAETPTLFDMCNYGSQDRLKADALSEAIFHEIRAMEEFKVCVVLDDFNSIIINKKERWSGKSPFVEPGTWQDIPRARLSLIDGFLGLVEDPPKNGTVIAAVNRSDYKAAGIERYRKYHAYKEYTTDRYTKDENKAAYKHYSLSCALDPVVEWDRYPKILALTGRSPYEMRKLAEQIY